jgi:hypothetical protein
MFKIDFKEKIKGIVGSENVLYTLTESGLIYSWGYLGNKRVTRSCDTTIPHLIKITEGSHRKPVKFNRFVLHNEPAVMDVNDQAWALQKGVWKRVKTFAADTTLKGVQFVGFK